MSEPGLVARILGRAAYEFSMMQPLIPTYIHLIASALFPIYTGAHASLSRPSSAAKPATKKHGKRKRVAAAAESDDEGDEEEQQMEGLSPSDAIIMPVLAGITLTGLYFLIKWMKDPALLNKILNGYFALFGVFSVSRLVTDVLDIGHSIIFPRRYALGGALYNVNGKEKKATPVAGDTKDKAAITSPLPGFLSRIPLPEGFRTLLWMDRQMPHNKWTLRMYLHRVFAGKVKIGPHGLIGFLSAVAAVAYFNLVGKPWYLTNLMGFGFSYGALQLMSPTTFGTGSLILAGLFFYDIYMVFYTPMMVTVAKSLDVPIKLVFPRPQPANAPADALPSQAMLGLGDVVLPGIMIGLALRYDLYLFYLRQQKRTPAKDDEAEKVEKPKYHSWAGRWSDHFWTHSLMGRPLFSISQHSKPEAPFTFPKTYFKASLVGYVLGMLTTLGVMHVWGHAQPALLYLVPGVVGSLWLTALVRGEFGQMWNFSEAVEEEDVASKEKTNGEEKEAGKEKDKSERSSFFSMSDKKAQEREARMKKALDKHISVDSESDNEHIANGDAKVKEVAGHRSDREVFSFSIEAPWQLNHPRSIPQRQEASSVAEANGHDESEASPLEKDKPNWAPTEIEASALEPAGKRVRLK
ncbi:intramembrane protease 2 [Lophiotrema nucula]|uniref:Intramembrane protease 2 n=1 Tax=Lophiotrema nucula TaxID=690887 RepID=A0A6A5ZB64_9PLEO|nr:intramembrane protease 2 [Lophiotrema nucula]